MKDIGFLFKFPGLLTDSTISRMTALVIMPTSHLPFHFIWEKSLSDFKVISPFFNFFFISSTGINFLSGVKARVMHVLAKDMYFVSGSEFYQLSVNK